MGTFSGNEAKGSAKFKIAMKNFLHQRSKREIFLEKLYTTCHQEYPLSESCKIAEHLGFCLEFFEPENLAFI